ncbi:hypothetical protein E2C06_34090, partial [Dankookia rubra]
MTSTDTELLELCAAWRQAVDRLIPIADRHAGMLDRDWSAADRVLKKEVEGEVFGLERRIFDTEAATLAGLKAKAGVLDYMDT